MFPQDEGRRRHGNLLQRIGATLDATDSVHDDEVLLLRKDGRGHLSVCCAQATRGMQQGELINNVLNFTGLDKK